MSQLVQVLQAMGVSLGLGIDVDGVDGPDTRRALQAIRTALPELEPWPNLLPGFGGSLAWIHRLEGHRGVPYWPGGASGVTLDPGVDLNHNSRADIARWYGEDIASRVEQALGVAGRAAASLLPIGEVRISREHAESLMPVVAAGYWRSVATRFDGLRRAPSLAQTAVLSLAYNRGPWNPHLAGLADSIRTGDWLVASSAVERMQQRRRDGIPSRRRAEALLLRLA